MACTLIPDTLAQRDPAVMAGSFVGLPVVNVPAYHALTREGADGVKRMHRMNRMKRWLAT